ncbi:response regulator [uncultured Roseobacter sp.]|uniref:response regulator n=1 Tax=uncultured Roseobacter sp. TaxID=114847 RepID=UPI00262DFC75|nr:response regulator [uncultured Roseobacter sp.]
MKILLVEDDLVFAHSVAEEFRSFGYSVDTVRSVSDGMSRILRVNYCLAILDVFVTDGATVSLSNFLRIRSPNIPILSITGATVFEHGDHNEAMSVDYLLRKPISPKEIVEIGSYLMGPNFPLPETCASMSPPV